MDFKIYCWGYSGSCEKYADYIAKAYNTKTEFFPINNEINNTFAIFIVPVHAQSIPKSAIACLKKLKTYNSYAFPAVVCGNISHGNSLFEIGKLLQNSGFVVLGGAKLIASHSYNICGLEIAKNRPNENDLNLLLNAIKNLIEIETKDYKKLNLKTFSNRTNILSKLPRKFLAKFSVKLPIVNCKCTNCSKCVSICPEGAIKKDFSINKKLCIRCLKCAIICPAKARRAKFSQPFIKLYLKSHKKDIKPVIY